MSEIATFFVPTALPKAAGTVARAAGGSAGGENFAGILAQFQAALQHVGLDVQTNAGQIAPLQNPQLIAQLSAALTQTGSDLSTENLAAQLQAIAGTGKGQPVPPQFQTLLDLLASGGSEQVDGNATGELDPMLAAQLAALQAIVQPSPAPQAQPAANSIASAGAATPAMGLRGTLEPEVSKTANAQDAAAYAADAAAENVEIPANLLSAPSARAQSNGNAKPGVGDNRAPLQSKTDAPADGTQDQFPDPLKTPGRASGASNSTVHLAASLGSSVATASAQQQSATGSSAPTGQAVAAPAPLHVPLTEAPQISVTVTNSPQAAVPLEALAVHIARKFNAGVSQFEIRLHPAELGQLDISLSVSDDGRIQAVLRAERAETLDILQRDARALEQQLRQAGLDVGSNSLSFSLSGGDRQRHTPFSDWPGFADAQDPAGLNMQQAAATYVAVRTSDGIDIRV